MDSTTSAEVIGPGVGQALRPRVTLRWVLSTWLPPVLGILTICGESTEVMGAEHTSRILLPLYHFLFGPISDASWGTLHHYIRKTGHFCGYGTISLLFLRAWRRSLWMKAMAVRRGAYQMAQMLVRVRVRAAVLAVVCTFLVACSDEFHQTFVPGRTGLFSDVMIDTTGALIFQVLFWCVLMLRRKPVGTQ